MTGHRIRSYLMAGFWILAGISAPLLLAGDLNPPVGPVAATMKTLQQVEPRIDVQTLGGSLSASYYINAPGSYYLTDNVIGQSGLNGIEIDSSNVTLDLRGFAVIGIFDGGTSGVLVPNSIASRGAGPLPHNIAVHNGSVEAWGAAGIDLVNAANCRVEQIRAWDNNGEGITIGSNSSVIDSHCETNGGAGIRAADNCIIKGSVARFNDNGGIRAATAASISGCLAQSNTNGGFFAERGSVLHNCSARSNFGAPAIDNRGGGSGSGFDLDDACSVSNCSGDQNSGDGLFAYNHLSIANSSFVGNSGDGIEAFDHVNVSNCLTNGNFQNGIYINNGTVTSCTASQNIQSGIRVFFSDVEVRGNTCASNLEHGILVADRARVTGNQCSGNGSFAGGFTGAGIYINGNRGTVDDNSVTENDDGVLVIGINSAVTRNIASGNGTDYNITGSNDVGPIGTAAALSSPWGNIGVVPPPTCIDGIQNGNETGIDCGGGTCPPCPDGQGCNLATDCISGNCSGGICQP